MPVRFADISSFTGICEVSSPADGFMPELSYGSHMFQDLVEADIFYCAIWNDERTLAYFPQHLDGLKDLFPQICPNMPQFNGLIRVVEPQGLHFWLDAVSNHAVCGWKKKKKTACPAK